MNVLILTSLIFLHMENLTESDRTPPNIGTYLQLFPNFGNYEQKRSPIRKSCIGERFFHNLDICFARFFSMPYLTDFFFSNKCVNFNEFDFFTLGEFPE